MPTQQETLQQVAQAKTYKDAGNDFFKNKQYRKALGRYHFVLLHVNGIHDPDEGNQGPKGPKATTFGEEDSGMGIAKMMAEQSQSKEEKLEKTSLEEIRLLKITTRVNMMTCLLLLYEEICEQQAQPMEVDDHPMEMTGDLPSPGGNNQSSNAMDVDDDAAGASAVATTGSAGSSSSTTNNQTPTTNPDLQKQEEEKSRLLSRCIEEGKKAVNLVEKFPNLPYPSGAQYAGKPYFKLGQGFLKEKNVEKAVEMFEMAGSKGGIDCRKEMNECKVLRKRIEKEDSKRMQMMFGGKLR
ncbi:unnamed protein product [Amoebophrya sp. A120]|nr:unnamed protein product [Amoebophrya sp. A120]|eukprot:GSA120T00015785001.1